MSTEVKFQKVQDAASKASGLVDGCITVTRAYDNLEVDQADRDALTDELQELIAKEIASGMGSKKKDAVKTELAAVWGPDWQKLRSLVEAYLVIQAWGAPKTVAGSAAARRRTSLFPTK